MPAIPAYRMVDVIAGWGELIKPGDQILTAGGGGWLSKAIVAGQSLITGRPSRWRHFQRAALDPGMVYSQETTYKLVNLAKDEGKIIRVWSRPDYLGPVRVRLCQEAEMNLGSVYDVTGLAAQGLRWLPWGDWLAARFDAPMLMFCSEAGIIGERTVLPDYFSGHDAQRSPQEINDYNTRHPPWQQTTFRLVAEKE